MTLSKQIKLLKALIDEVGNRPVIQYTDKWDFEPNEDYYGHNIPVREEWHLSDVLSAYETKNGELWERFGSTAAFRELEQVMRDGKCWVFEKEYDDTKAAFFEKHPDYLKKRRREFNALMSTLTPYITPIRNIFR